MRKCHRISAVLAASAMMIAGASSAIAQVPQGLPPGMIWPSLTTSDFDQMHAAAALLYQGRPVGAKERWRNPETHNAGSITLTRDFDMKGMTCRSMEYRIRFGQPSKQHDHYAIDWCAVPDGSWKIVDQHELR
jgi:surface antigen